MKKVITASILVLAMAAGSAYAYGHGYGMRGHGKGWSGYSQSGSPCGGFGGPGMMGQGRGMRGAGFTGNPADCPRGYWGNQPAWTVEQRQQFLDATVDLRKQMNAKQFELREARRNPSTTPDQLGTLQKELIDLRTQLDTKAQQINSAAQ